LKSFSEFIKKIRDNGHNPIAVTQWYCEETFIFETPNAAEAAYKAFGEEGFGWWFGKDEFMRLVEEYEFVYPDTKILIYWL
jgi:hypothetical protein